MTKRRRQAAGVIPESSGNHARSAASVPRSSVGEPAANVAPVEKSVGSKKRDASPVWGEGYYHELVERSDDMFLTMDTGGIIAAANRGAERVLGFSPEELVGTKLMDHLAPGELERAGAVFARIATSTDVVKEEFEHVAKDGRSVFMDVSGRAIWVDGRVVGLEGIARDVTDRHILQEALTYQALHDPLTGMPNRSLFADRLIQALAGARRSSSGVAVLLLDLDGFKLINDTHGHDVGDEVLNTVAQALSREMRASESAARLGGDEFAFIIENVATEAELAAVASRILSAVTEPIALDDRFTHVTGSLGIALAEPGDDPTSLLRNADIAMYQAKAKRRGSFAFFKPQDPGPTCAGSVSPKQHSRTHAKPAS
jgi:diguanylate cyclase (GGDEF)-like protein/PAS domain S-box-containing protein